MAWPTEQTIFAWLHREPEFKEMYDEAKRQQESAHVEHQLKLADGSNGDIEWVKLQIKVRDGILKRRADKEARLLAAQVGEDVLSRAASEMVSTVAGLQNKKDS